jgi:two-component system, OmpR family, sensor histidine kinase KdpD
VTEERPHGGPENAAELVATLTHEIRAPVSTIRGLVATTLTHYDGLNDGERREFLELIRHESERLERTVEQIAAALKLDAGSIHWDRRPHDVGAFVRGTVDGTDLTPHPVELDVEDGVRASIDVTQLAFGLRQLLDNAATFSPPDAPIAVALRRDGGEAVIEVSDGGPGIPPAQREAVFDRFAAWRPAGYEDRPGTGLGLYLCRAIARAHGGEASIVDGSTGGTMLTVRLPVEG